MAPSLTGPAAPGRNERHNLTSAFADAPDDSTPRGAAPRFALRRVPKDAMQPDRLRGPKTALPGPDASRWTWRPQRTATQPVVAAPAKALRLLQPVPMDFRFLPKDVPDTTQTPSQRKESGRGLPACPKTHERRLPEDDTGNEMGKLSFRALLHSKVRA